MALETSSILLKEYTYRLPPDKIASHPLQKRSDSKLMVYKSGRIENATFNQLPGFIEAGTLVVFNNTLVIEARMQFQKQSGGAIELFCLEPLGRSMELALQQSGSTEWKCLVGGASKWKAGQELEKAITVNDNLILLKAFYKAKLDDGFAIRFEWDAAGVIFADVLHAAGAIPLPPYIKRPSADMDAERYQTVFARQPGSVAAPTAALHFTEELFGDLADKKIQTAFLTLNVGAGTFKPVKSETIAGHQMHGEDFSVSQDLLRSVMAAERILAVGTTSLRTLESLYWLGIKLMVGKLENGWELLQWEAYELETNIDSTISLQAVLDWMMAHSVDVLHCRTSLLIVPGYKFRIPVGLVTNFHQPGSTLLLLVAAFAGEAWKEIYQHALDNDYRFLSYGDSSLLWR